MRLNRPVTAAFACLCVAATALACKHNATTDNSGGDCRSSLSMFTSPAPGTATLTGKFYWDETILIYDTATNSLVAQGTPATDRTSFTLTGLPSGRRDYVIRASSDGGQETLDEGEFTVL